MNISDALTGQRQAVIDASLALDILLGEPDRRAEARSFLAASIEAGVLLIAPPTFAAETDTGLRQAIHRRGVPESTLPGLYRALDALPIEIIFDKVEIMAVRLRARELAAMLNQPSVYDCTYAALAELRQCDFWTADKTFANVAGQKQRKSDGTTAPTLSNVQLISLYAHRK